MKFWRTWPYWLKGGVIAGGVNSLFVIALYSCIYIFGSFLCLVFYDFSLIDLALLILEFISSLFGYEFYWLFLEKHGPIISIGVWFVLGSLIGLFIGLLRKNNKKRQAP